jgi:acetyltransferase
VGDADAARYGNALHAIGGAGADAVVVVLTAQAATDSPGVARAVIGATRGWPVPIAAAFVGGARVAPGARALEEAGIPCYPFPEPAVGMLGGMARLFERRAQPAGPASPAAPSAAEGKALARLRASGHRALGLPELAPVLESYGIPCAAARPAATPAEAAAAAAALGFPVALKVLSPDISHKSDVGGVRLGIGSAAEVAAAAAAMLSGVRAARPGARIEGVLVQRMAPAGKELLLGTVRDAQFGPMIVVGFGGIYVEVLKDTAARLCPLTAADALAMLDELRMAPVLKGVRGEPPVNLDALADAICRFGRLAVDAAEVAEMEINPLVADARGVIAVDARARM